MNTFAQGKYTMGDSEEDSSDESSDSDIDLFIQKTMNHSAASA